MMTQKFSSKELQMFKLLMKIFKLSKYPIVVKNMNQNDQKRKKYLWTRFRTTLSSSQSIKLILNLWKRLMKRNYQSKKEFTTFLTHLIIKKRIKSNDKVERYPHRQKIVVKALQDPILQTSFKD